MYQLDSVHYGNFNQQLPNQIQEITQLNIIFIKSQIPTTYYYTFSGANTWSYICVVNNNRELLKTINLDFKGKLRSKLWSKLRFLAKTPV